MIVPIQSSPVITMEEANRFLRETFDARPQQALRG